LLISCQFGYLATRLTCAISTCVAILANVFTAYNMLASELQGRLSVAESVPSTPIPTKVHKESVSLVVLHSTLNEKRAVQSFLLCAAYESLFSGSLIIEHSFGDSFYCYDSTGRPVTADDCEVLTKVINRDIDDKFPVVASQRSKVAHVICFNYARIWFWRAFPA